MIQVVRVKDPSIMSLRPLAGIKEIAKKEKYEECKLNPNKLTGWVAITLDMARTSSLNIKWISISTTPNDVHFILRFSLFFLRIN